MKIKLLDTERTRRNNLAGIEINLLGKKSGTIYFMVERADFAVYFSSDEDSLLKHSQTFNSSILPIISNEDLVLISKSLDKF